MDNLKEVDTQIAILEIKLKSLKEQRDEVRILKLSEDELDFFENIGEVFAPSAHEVLLEDDGIKINFEIMTYDYKPYVNPFSVDFIKNPKLNKLFSIGAFDIREDEFEKLPQVKSILNARKNRIKDYLKEVKRVAKKHGISSEALLDFLLY